MSVDRVLARSQTTPLRVAPPVSQAEEVEDLSLPPYFRWRDVIDRVVAAFLLIPALPIIGVAILLVRLTSRGPGLYRQTRMGKDGRVFTLYKIRTMRQDAEAATGPVWSMGKDPRITAVGDVLRRLHLDEFPQLINIIKGEMLLIGPRPERPEIVEVLVEEIPGYANRLAVRPGVTGLAQINLDPDVDLKSVRRKLALDVEYITSAGPSLDARIFLYTVGLLLGICGGRTRRALRIHREVPEVNGRRSKAEVFPKVATFR